MDQKDEEKRVQLMSARILEEEFVDMVDLALQKVRVVLFHVCLSVSRYRRLYKLENVHHCRMHFRWLVSVLVLKWTFVVILLCINNQ